MYRIRKEYNLDFSEDIVDTLTFPATLPAIIDDPVSYLPRDIPHHDILIALAVNEELLYSFLKQFPQSRAVIVPIEETHWVSPFAISSIRELCNRNRIEISFPKPFCHFNPSSPILKDFKKRYKIGIPELQIHTENRVIKELYVKCSAPCGATYYTAQGLKGKSLDDDLILVIDKCLSSYPCTAGTELDREFEDSIIHHAVKIQRNVLSSIKDFIPDRT